MNCPNCAVLREALGGLLDRIRSEPTMSGHLRNMSLRQDGAGHQTSDAIRFAKQVLSEALRPDTSEVNKP